MPYTRKAYAFLAIALLLAACGARDDEQRFEVTGVVVESLADGQIVIDHAEIPGFMPAMIMPFYIDVSDPLASQLRPGDRVAFTFVVSGDSSMATAFRRIESAPPSRAGEGAGGAGSAQSPRLREGDRLPAFQLIDQSGDAFTEDDLRGKYTVLTFIFTRCPVPEFCPRMMSHFAELQNRIRSAPGLENVRLASVSIDPEYDRPEVLRAYGEAHGADFATWTFATGAREDVDALRKRFAVVVQPSAGSIDHTLATALIGPDLSLITLWRGNAWKPDEVMDALGSGGRKTEN